MKRFAILAAGLMVLASCNYKLSYDDYVIPIDESYTAVPANDFLGSIGVNSSINSRGENVAKTLECCKYIGARWIRSGYGGEDGFNYLIQNYPLLKFSIAIGTGAADDGIQKAIDRGLWLKERNALLAFEGANEPNNWSIYYDGEAGGGQFSWVPVAKMHRDFYTRIRQEESLRDVDVWGPSECGAMTDNCGLQFTTIPKNAGCLLPEGTTFCDCVNVHNYFVHPSWPAVQNNQTWVASDPTSACKVDGLYGNHSVTWAKKFQGYSEKECMTLRRVTTETGATINEAVSDSLQGLMYMSCYLAQFARGWEYTAMYILRDRSDESGNQTFGFYAPDYTPRKSAHYLHNLTTILADEKSIENPGRLSYSIPDKPETVHTLLLQKYDGTFFLVLWDERFAGGTDNFVLRLGKTCDKVDVYDVLQGTDVIDTLENVSEVQLSMTSHPVILAFK